jgi:hypothetical protein
MSAETAEAWLRTHPEVEIVSRERLPKTSRDNGKFISTGSQSW